MRVLVVDDYLDNVQSMAMLLRMYGHDVTTAQSGRAALQLAKSNYPEVVLLDIAMPEMNGYEVASQLRSVLHNHVVLIAITAFGFEEEKRKCFEAGFDYHVVKPADPVKLERLIRELPSALSREQGLLSPDEPVRNPGHRYLQ